MKKAILLAMGAALILPYGVMAEEKPEHAKLDDMQKYVTLHDGTEPPFKNKYWDHYEEGIYVDAIFGQPLFSSTHKFDSGTGWPSFTQPIEVQHVQEKADYKLGMKRTEVRSEKSDAHLGHVFTDGPAAYGGERYCINSASLDFIPRDKMEEEGYGEYLYLFDEPPVAPEKFKK